jgi:hypothetical protein
MASCGNITITDGVTKVTAIKGEFTPRNIGEGNSGTCGTITIGGTVTGAITTSPYTYNGKGTSSGTSPQMAVPTATLNGTKTVATFAMVDYSLNVNYTLLRNIGKNTEFVGIPTEPIVVKKGAGDKYETETPLTYQLNDLLLAADAQDITQADGIAIHLEKAGDNLTQDGSGDSWGEALSRGSNVWFDETEEDW